MTWFAVLACSAALAQTPLIQIDPYALPEKVRQSLGDLAADADVLVLGETHGTQEVPAIAAALLEPLTKLGYGALALEIPSSDREALTNWALGKTQSIPQFFAQPWPDGRGNIQALALIRTALSPPYSWKLICFDLSEEDAADFALPAEQKPNQAEPPQPDDGAREFVKRDAAMAAHLAKQRSGIADDRKVLAVCGDMHARTAKSRPAVDAKNKPADDFMNKLWPCFAAQLAMNRPSWRVRSVRVVPHSGGFFAMMSVEGEPDPTEGKVHPIRSTKRLDEAEAHPLTDAPYDWQLDLPRATPATFLTTPGFPHQ
jgi:hypothetical protein